MKEYLGPFVIEIFRGEDLHEEFRIVDDDGAGYTRYAAGSWPWGFVGRPTPDPIDLAVTYNDTKGPGTIEVTATRGVIATWPTGTHDAFLFHDAEGAEQEQDKEMLIHFRFIVRETGA